MRVRVTVRVRVRVRARVRVGVRVSRGGTPTARLSSVAPYLPYISLYLPTSPYISQVRASRLHPLPISP